MAVKPVHLEIMTPSKLFYKGDVEMVIVTTLDGDEGFMAGHVWGCKLLKVGELWVKEVGAAKNEWKIAAVAGGFIDCQDSIVIYTDAVEWAEDIDMKRVLSEKATAEDWIAKHEKDADPEEVEAAKRAIAKADARASVAGGGKKR